MNRQEWSRFICLYAHSEIDVIDGRVCFNKLAAVCWVHCVSCLRFLWGALDKQQIRTYWLGEWRIMSVAMICKVFRTSWCSSYALPINMLRLLENIVKNYLRDLAIRITVKQWWYTHANKFVLYTFAEITFNYFHSGSQWIASNLNGFLKMNQLYYYCEINEIISVANVSNKILRGIIFKRAVLSSIHPMFRLQSLHITHHMCVSLCRDLK